MGEVATEERERWPPVRSTRAGSTALGTAVQKFSGVAWLSSSERKSQNVTFVFLLTSFFFLLSEISSNFHEFSQV
jgi:hypothetical protein